VRRLVLAALVASAACNGASSTSDGGAGTTGTAGASGGAGTGGGGAGTGGGGAGTGGGAGGGAAGHTGAGGLGALPACPGAQPIPETVRACRTGSDCMPIGICGPNYFSGGCGAAFGAPHECTTDGECGTDRVCVTAPEAACTQPGGTVCDNRCPKKACAPGETCNATTGHCAPTPCGADYACREGYLCAPTRDGADAHGCAVAKCTTDGYKCPAGWECRVDAWVQQNGCSPVSCVGGAFQCPPNHDCVASSTSPHHCQPRACTSDKTCDCGACIQGSCQERLFVCSPPPPP
jgi:hypothetical protein